MLYDRAGILCGRRVLSDRRMATVSARFRELFRHAFIAGAEGFVLAHNHPSGDFRPSAQDVAATRSLAALARAMEFEFLDHVIVGGASAISMRRAGLMP
jgi:DNA repair protein RadC